jgi:LPS export ABC transporter protein LptC
LRRSRARAALIAAVTLALVALGFVLGRTMLARQETARTGTSLRADVSQRIREFRRVKVKDGRTVWELNAREAQYFEERGEVVVTRPQLSFFGADGESIAVKGREGRVHLSGANELEKIELSGGIEVRVGDYVLHTDQAIWVQAQDVILSPGRVDVKGDQIALDGEGMLVDLARQRVQFLRGVRTTLRGDGAPAAPHGADVSRSSAGEAARLAAREAESAVALAGGAGAAH